MRQQDIICDFSTSDSWVILSPIEQSIKKKIEAVGTPLKDWDINIYRGVLTGCNEAFIISTAKRNEILANCQTEDERKRTAEIIRPILRGRDIKRYGYEWADLWLIYIPWHFPFQFDENIQGASDKAERAFKEQYPAVFSHMLQYKEQLSKRNKAETGIRYEWYAMQRWGAKYWEDFSKPKIVWNRIAAIKQFAKVDESVYIQDSMHFIIGEKLKFFTLSLFCLLVMPQVVLCWLLALEKSKIFVSTVALSKIFTPAKSISSNGFVLFAKKSLVFSPYPARIHLLDVM